MQPTSQLYVFGFDIKNLTRQNIWQFSHTFQKTGRNILLNLPITQNHRNNILPVNLGGGPTPRTTVKSPTFFGEFASYVHPIFPRPRNILVKAMIGLWVNRKCVFRHQLASFPLDYFKLVNRVFGN